MEVLRDTKEIEKEDARTGTTHYVKSKGLRNIGNFYNAEGGWVKEISYGLS